MWRVPFVAPPTGPTARPFMLSVPPVRFSVVVPLLTVLLSMMLVEMFAVPPLTLNVPLDAAVPPLLEAIRNELLTFNTPVELALDPTVNVPLIAPPADPKL